MNSARRAIKLSVITASGCGRHREIAIESRVDALRARMRAECRSNGDAARIRRSGNESGINQRRGSLRARLDEIK